MYHYSVRSLALIFMSIPVIAQPEILWTKTFGGEDNDSGLYLRCIADDNLVVGYNSSYGLGIEDAWILKIDSLGEPEWTSQYGGAEYDVFYSVCRGYSTEAYSARYIAAGGTTSQGAGESDAFFVNRGDSGTLWQHTYGGPEWDEARSIQFTFSYGYIATGGTCSYGAGSMDVWLLRLNYGGGLSWDGVYGGPGTDLGISVLNGSDGGYIIAGITDSFGAGGNDIYVLKTDNDGILLWEKTYGGVLDDRCTSMIMTSDGGYLISGYTHSFGAGGSDVWLLRLDSNGELLWERTYGGIDDDWGNSVQEIQQSGFIIVGGTCSYGAGNSDLYMIRTDSIGNVYWDFTLGGPGDEQGNSVDITQDDGCIMVGETNSTGAGEDDLWLVRTGTLLGITDTSYCLPSAVQILNATPNPFTESISISLALPESGTANVIIYDIQGRPISTVATSHISSGIQYLLWSGEDDSGERLPSGQYILRVSTETGADTEKLLLLR